MSEGRKNDEGKLRLDLITPEMKRALGEVLTHGCKKYDARNWEKGLAYHRVLGAIYRHLLAWEEGEKIDQDSGLPHVELAFCELAFLVTYERRNMKEFDDVHGDSNS